ncbi:MAG: hypothetical protein J7M08_01815 [Planctomycetes bacterium]|nr:hypothetical protein [Planctomycetota bacterium]
MSTKKDAQVSCSICGAALDDFFGTYPNAVCRECDGRAVNADGHPPAHDTWADAGDNPVFIDGVKCWRRYRFGGYVTMRDMHNCSNISEFYELHMPERLGRRKKNAK